MISFAVVQLLSSVRLFATPWTAACRASLSFTISRSLLKLMSIESVMPSDHLTLCRPLLLLPSIFPSIRVFFSELALHIRWSKYWSFRFSLLSDLIIFKHLVPHILKTFADKSCKKELFHLGTADILDRIFLCHWQYVCVADDGVCLLQHVLSALLEKNCLQCGRPGFNPWVG